MADAECYQKTVDDRVIINNVRAYYAQPFIAGDWTDLRCGFFLSLTDAVNDDLPNGAFAESIGDGVHLLGTADRYALGVADTVTGNTFIGFTNAYGRLPAQGNTELVSSDAAVGTTNSNFWRPRNSQQNICAAIIDGSFTRGQILDNAQQHFPQIPANTGGYAVLFAIQLLRDNPASKTITARIKSSTKSADMLYTNTPTKELIRDNMQNWPPSQQMGPATLSNVPNAFFFYWPFRKTRLRVHSIALLRADGTGTGPGTRQLSSALS